jgi:hypothetical protein
MRGLNIASSSKSWPSTKVVGIRENELTKRDQSDKVAQKRHVLNLAIDLRLEISAVSIVSHQSAATRGIYTSRPSRSPKACSAGRA